MAKNNEVFEPATKRQTWALYCITKKDYRDANLSKQEASKMLSELMGQTSKASEKRVKKSGNIFIEDFNAQYSNIIEKLLEDFKTKVLNVRSILEVDTKMTSEKYKRYNFYGYGCGVVWLKYHKGSKSLAAFDEYVSDIYQKRVIKDIESKLGKEVCDYMQAQGCPVSALMFQDLRIKLSYYWMCAEIVKAHGKKMEVDYMDD